LLDFSGDSPNQSLVLLQIHLENTEENHLLKSDFHDKKNEKGVLITLLDRKDLEFVEIECSLFLLYF